MNLTNEQLLKEYFDNYQSGQVVTIPVIWLQQLGLDTKAAADTLNCDARAVRAQILLQLLADKQSDRRAVLPPINNRKEAFELRRIYLEGWVPKMSNLCNEIICGPILECVLGTIVCWSCKQRVTPEQVADNDGFCPKCGVEHANDEDED